MVPQDVMVIGFLVLLEGLLSIDNALVLAMLAKDLPPEQRKKALTYGIAGAIIFRFIAIGFASYLMEWRWVKFVGGGYLLYIGFENLLQGEKARVAESKKRGFWATVAMIELMDIAFAVDSILAALALSSKTWIVVTGGVLGMIMMRFAASVFIKLLDRFPNFEVTAYLLVILIGFKIILEGFQFDSLHFHDLTSFSFWIFWGLMFACIGYGFKKPKRKKHADL